MEFVVIEEVLKVPGFRMKSFMELFPLSIQIKERLK
jgi:hypothetical protein